MTIGWNIGNSLEVPSGETGWGNPRVTQRLIDSVKQAGFNTIRIPCAWNSYADQQTLVIQQSWLSRVQQVVDYCLNNDMHVILNSHWDGGWLEEHPTFSKQAEVNEKQLAYWTQVANHFKDYDYRLLFAGTNEVRANYGTPTAEHITVQESYNQTFVDAVRATGGNNRNRNLVVQTYNTNISHGINFFSLPTDVVEGHLMVEVHYYDPYNFTLNEGATNYTWGQPFRAVGSNDNWGQEAYVDNLFKQVKEEWVDRGYPVIMGEYGVIHRKALTGATLEMHTSAREYWLEYITSAAIRNGIIPYYWDNGWGGNNGFALFNRNTGAVVDRGALQSLMNAAGVGVHVPRYVLSTSRKGSGSIQLSSGRVRFNQGDEVTLTATPEAGWRFEGWSGDHTGIENPATITITKDMAVTANFVLGTSVSAPAQNESVSIFPNPSSNGQLTIELSRRMDEVVVRVIDLKGRIILEHQESNSQSLSLTVDAPPGMYLVQVESPKSFTSKRITLL